jgi:hypothetical protein
MSLKPPQVGRRHKHDNDARKQKKQKEPKREEKKEQG